MLRNETVPDKTILKNVNQRLMRTGMGARCRVAVTVSRGQVSLSGNIQYENQRLPALRAVGQVEGVRGVADHLRVLARESR